MNRKVYEVKENTCIHYNSCLKYNSVVFHPAIKTDTQRVVAGEISAFPHQKQAVLAGHQDLLRHLSRDLTVEPRHLQQRNHFLKWPDKSTTNYAMLDFSAAKL